MNASRLSDPLNLAITILRGIVGLVFILAAISKIIDPGGFATSIINYRLIPSDPAMLVATVLPWIEVLVGLGLICGLFVRGSSFLALVLLIVMTAAVFSALMRGLDISCGCFSQTPAAEPIGWKKIGENVVLVALSFLIFRSPDNGFSPARVIRERFFRPPPDR
jgi:uncharacterized membrane protein YphA (DoxX/SURF4 family)